MSNKLPLSFEHLYPAYYPRVNRWAYRLLGHHQTAENVARETFLHAWRSLAIFDPVKGALSTWLYRVIVQVTGDQVGYRKAYLATIPLDNVTWELRNCEAADPQIHYEGSAEQVTVAFGVLTENERLGLALLGSGYRELEIARRVGKTLRTVCTWQTLGRTHLLQRMEAE